MKKVGPSAYLTNHLNILHVFVEVESFSQNLEFKKFNNIEFLEGKSFVKGKYYMLSLKKNLFQKF
jgi:hypothetical protein